MSTVMLCGGKPVPAVIKDDRWVTWIEPFGPHNEPVYMFAPVKTIIAVMRSSAMKYKGYEYPDDNTALLDFIAVNWAELCEMPKAKAV